MWLENRRALLEHHKGLIVFEGGLAFGVGDLINDLRGVEVPLVWVTFSARDTLDERAQVDRVTEALRRDLVKEPLPLGMPLTYTLQDLKRYAEQFSPMTLAFSGLEHVPNIVPSLLQLRRTGAWLILAFTRLPEDIDLPTDALILRPEQLRLSEEEAFELATGRLDSGELHALYEKVDGAVLAFRSRLAKQFGEPPPLTHGPDGPRYLQDDAPLMPDRPVLKALLKRGRYREALELACARLPDEVPSFIEEAGHYFY